MVVESLIDAMNAHALKFNDGGLVTFVSTDGSGDLPCRQIDEGLAPGALVRCAFDNDPVGENPWAKVREAYPAGPLSTTSPQPV